MVTDRPAADELGKSVLDGALSCFRANKGWADKAIVQLPDDKLHIPLDPNTNSIAVIMKHIAGNLLSRWTDFLTTDGEKPDRNRDEEFMVAADASRAEIMQVWATSWQLTFDTVSALRPEDLAHAITIRREPHTVMQAIARQIAHHASHAGQIILLAKHWKGPEWKTLSIPRGQSEAVNAAFAAKFGSK